MFNSGVSRVGDMLDLAVAKNIVSKTGAWFSYGEERLGQGRENSKEFLEQNPKITAEIEKKVYEAYSVDAEVGADKSADKTADKSKEDKTERAGAVADKAAVADKDDDKKAVKAPQPIAAATKVKKPMVASK